MIDFPANPTVGQQFTDAGVTWTWDGVKWLAAGTSPGYLLLTGGVLSGNLGGVTADFSGQVNAQTLAGPTGVTPPVAAASPPVADNSLDLATTAWVNANVVRWGDNRIINGDMRIDQRNNGGVGNVNTYILDRWYCWGSQPGKFTDLSRYTALLPGLAATGFGYNLVASSASAYTVPAAESYGFGQAIEADMMADFAFGTASAQPVTLSFWAYSSLSGMFGGSLQNYASTRSYPFSFSIPVANTWTKIALTIPGDTGGTWVLQGNGGGAWLNFDFGSGATVRAPAGAWATGNFVSANGAISLVSNNGAQFNITGVKLEVGTVATPFNRQSLAKSMADCQRYYQTGNIRVRGWSGAVVGIVVGHSMLYPVNMRAAPTLVDQYTSIVAATPGVQPVSPSTIYVYGISTTINTQLSLDGTFTASAEL
jgi:hypothetical protein